MPERIRLKVHAAVPKEIEETFTAFNMKNKSIPGWYVGDDGCHYWTGSRSNMGYGQVTFRGKRYLVHRFRYMQEIGPIPDGLVLDHFACDHGHLGCVNPHHCRPVTQWENNLRGNSTSAKNAAKTHCIRGHPLSGDNLMACFLKLGARACKECNKLRNRRRWVEKAAKEGRVPYKIGSKLCKAGLHPLSGDNLMPSHLRQGHRCCRECFNTHRRERYKPKLTRGPAEPRKNRAPRTPPSGGCRSGRHELSGDNLLQTVIGHRWRRYRCRACHNEKQRQDYARRKAA